MLFWIILSICRKNVSNFKHEKERIEMKLIDNLIFVC